MSISVAGYPFITAYLKGEEAHLVTSEHISRLLRVSDIAEAIDVLKGTDIGDYLGGVLINTYDEMDERLWLYLGDRLKPIRWFTLVPSDILKIIDAYIVKYDVLNIKAVMQGILTGKKARLVPLGIINDLGLLPELGGAPDMTAVSGLLVMCGLGEYAAILKDFKAGEGERDATQAKLDSEYYRGLTGTLRKMHDGDTLVKGFGVLADLTNLNVVLRAVVKGMAAEAASYIIGNGYQVSGEKAGELLALKVNDLPERVPYLYRPLTLEAVDSYEKTRNITVIEEKFDRHKFRLLKEMTALKLMSPLVIFWYLILKETELKNLRLVFKALFDGRPLEEIRTSLVMNA